MDLVRPLATERQRWPTPEAPSEALDELAAVAGRTSSYRNWPSTGCPSSDTVLYATVYRPKGADTRSLIETTTPSTRTDPASTRRAGRVSTRNAFGAPLSLNRTLTVSTACFSTAVDGAAAELAGVVLVVPQAEPAPDVDEAFVQHVG